MYEQTRHDGFGEEVKRRIMIGTYALSSGYYEAYYGTAQKVRTKIAQDFAAAFEQVDFVVTPTSPTVAFKLGERTADPLAMYLSDYYTVPMPLAGIPAISIPCGLSEGLPVGFQIAGPAFSESRILDAAHALEQAIGFEGVPVRMNYEPVIGIEIHVQLRTRTKMFCGCALSFGEEPNTHTCPVCLGHPGTLPVTNAEAVHYGLMIAMALDCEIAPRSIFHRKNYFYPDLPEGLPDQPVRHPAVHRRAGSATCASTACTWRRTPPSSCTPAARGGSTAPRRASSTSTAAARRWSRSSPSPTCARPPRPRSSAGCSRPRCGAWACPT